MQCFQHQLWCCVCRNNTRLQHILRLLFLLKEQALITFIGNYVRFGDANSSGATHLGVHNR